MIALDTNLLVYAHRIQMQEHVAAQAALEEAARRSGGWGIPLPCVGEFWMVVTHPQAEGGPALPRDAREFLSALAEAGARVLYPLAGFAERVAALGASLETRGVMIFDLQIGLIAKEAGAMEIWTHDRNFVSVPGLKVIDPL